MQKVTPHLWFDKEAEDAVKFYTSLFPNSKTGNASRYGKEGFEIHRMPEGTVMTQDFQIAGLSIIALNGGPVFKFNPSVSFTVSCSEVAELDRLWSALSDGGSILMPYQEYPFSKKYGWCNDKFGLSWQLGLSEESLSVTPSLIFTGDKAGKAKEAMDFYTSVFKNSKIEFTYPYGAGKEPDKPENLAHAVFYLEGQKFIAMDSAREHGFTFNEAISFLVNCDTQDEVDYFWNKMSANPASEQCGWLKDKFGVSWQIVPQQLSKLISDPNKGKAGRVMNAMLQMKKLDVKKLQEAYDQE